MKKEILSLLLLALLATLVTAPLDSERVANTAGSPISPVVYLPLVSSKYPTPVKVYLPLLYK